MKTLDARIAVIAVYKDDVPVSLAQVMSNEVQIRLHIRRHFESNRSLKQ